MDGTIESWDHGCGIIRGEDGRTYFAHHREFLKCKSNPRWRVNVEVGQDVSFEPGVDIERGGRDNAANIEYDDRPRLFRFAYFKDYEQTIRALAGLQPGRERWGSSSLDVEVRAAALRAQADTENWAARERERLLARGIPIDEETVGQRVEARIASRVFREQFDVLCSYFERTFERVQLENKLIHSQTHAAFNTGLGDKFDRDIYVVFKAGAQGTQFVFDRFCDENMVGRMFPRRPEAANYFLDVSTRQRVPADHVYFDIELEFFPDREHLFEDNRSRFPQSWQSMGYAEFSDRLDVLLLRARGRVRRNLHAAIPFYYPSRKRIQMLLPATFAPGTPDEETRALVVSREGAGYSVETIMPLPWAYKHARLLTKPDRDDWLDF
jgi:hypothetical protein